LSKAALDHAEDTGSKGIFGDIVSNGCSLSDRINK